MADSPREKLILKDFQPIINIVAWEFPDKAQVDSITDQVGLTGISFPISEANEKQLWRAVFKAALRARPQILAELLSIIEDDLSDQSRPALKEALREVGRSCVSRVLNKNYPDLGDQADELLKANTLQDMTAAAQELRETALNARRLLMRPLLTDAHLQIAPSVLDPEQRRMELAELAVDVVTAVDYLLILLGKSAAASSRLVLSDEAGADRGHGASDDEAADRLDRRRLDARNTAVRVGMLLHRQDKLLVLVGHGAGSTRTGKACDKGKRII
jgi:hypothetical protein